MEQVVALSHADQSWRCRASSCTSTAVRSVFIFRLSGLFSIDIFPTRGLSSFSSSSSSFSSSFSFPFSLTGIRPSVHPSTSTTSESLMEISLMALASLSLSLSLSLFRSFFLSPSGRAGSLSRHPIANELSRRFPPRAH